MADDQYRAAGCRPARRPRRAPARGAPTRGRRGGGIRVSRVRVRSSGDHARRPGGSAASRRGV